MKNIEKPITFIAAHSIGIISILRLLWDAMQVLVSEGPMTLDSPFATLAFFYTAVLYVFYLYRSIVD